jgi:hypothetical protein
MKRFIEQGGLWDLFAAVGLTLLVAGMGWTYWPLAPLALGLALLLLGIWGAAVVGEDPSGTRTRDQRRRRRRQTAAAHLAGKGRLADEDDDA